MRLVDAAESDWIRKAERWLKQLARDEGSASIETAVSLTVVFSLAFWLFEMSMFAYTYAVLDDAAHEGIRYAIAHGADSSNCSGPSNGCIDTSGSNVTAVVKAVSKSSFHNITAITVTVSYPDVTKAAPGSLVKVAISYPYIPYIKLAGFNQTATVSAQGRIVY